MSPQTRREIAQLLARYDLSPVHRLGQHFLADANITRKIVELAAVGPGVKVIEVGAGTGTLTRALAESGAHVVAYEVDRGLRPVLEEVIGDLDVDLRFVDVMDLDLIDELEGSGWVMVANLPYNVGTPLVLDCLRAVPSIDRFVVMVQREVAERLAAEPGSPAYGLPSVIAGIYSEAVVEFKVPAQVFFPPPRVESAVVTLQRVPVPAGAERAVELAQAGFGQRRKMLRRSLSNVLADPAAVLDEAGFPDTARAEELSPDDYLKLAAVAP